MLALEGLRILALEEERRIAYYRAAQGAFTFEYPDDDLPGWDGETIASRCLVASLSRAFHRYSHYDYGNPWMDELRGLLTVLEYMMTCDQQEYFWCLDKDVQFEQGPLDGAWPLLAYLARNAMAKMEGGSSSNQNPWTLDRFVARCGVKVRPIA